MRSLITTNPECTVFNVEPNADLVVIPMVETANQMDTWVVTHWAHPPGFHPFDGKDHWIAHVAVNSLDAGYSISNALIEAMGGSGNIVALQGKLDTDPAQKRFTGLQQALTEHPEVKMLDQQTANWDRTQAFPIVQAWLTRYGEEIDGIWAGNDDMALGALEALRAAGLAGQIPFVGVDGIPEAIEAISRGEMVQTVSSDAYYQGSIGLAMGVCVLTGEVPAPAEWTKEQREFYLRLVDINQHNVEQYLKEPDPAAYASDWECDKLWSRNTGAAF
jgi:ribose transport system substrate-binding protein